MYHLEANCGESPEFATVNATPLELYVGFPCVVKLSDGPFVKSILTDFPNAESAGHDDVVRGSQFEYVCATDILEYNRIISASDVCDNRMLGTERFRDAEINGWREVVEGGELKNVIVEVGFTEN
jgi:hypothetical protein